jgi:hypothetical protein
MTPTIAYLIFGISMKHIDTRIGQFLFSGLAIILLIFAGVWIYNLTQSSSFSIYTYVLLVAILIWSCLIAFYRYSQLRKIWVLLIDILSISAIGIIVSLLLLIL